MNKKLFKAMPLSERISLNFCWFWKVKKCFRHILYAVCLSLLITEVCVRMGLVNDHLWKNIFMVVLDGILGGHGGYLAAKEICDDRE